MSDFCVGNGSLRTPASLEELYAPVIAEFVAMNLDAMRKRAARGRPLTAKEFLNERAEIVRRLRARQEALQ